MRIFPDDSRIALYAAGLWPIKWFVVYVSIPLTYFSSSDNTCIETQSILYIQCAQLYRSNGIPLHKVENSTRLREFNYSVSTTLVPFMHSGIDFIG